MKSKNKTLWIGLASGLMLAAPLCTTMSAQRVDTYRAQIRGGGGDRSGCTAQVQVDDVAEIEFSGDEVRIRTLSGAPATWRGMECNQQLPLSPLEFRFRGVDGRGRQTLLRDPAGNRGIAVVRIDDPQGGRGDYKFDLEWRTANVVNPGVIPGPVTGPGPDRDRDGAWNRDRNGRWNDEVRFTGRGDGNFNDFRGPDDKLYDCNVTVDRRGTVTVTFDTARRTRLTFKGRLTRFDRDLIVADMSGRGVRGSMEIRLTGRDRVTDISMSASGRERFELRWHR